MGCESDTDFDFAPDAYDKVSAESMAAMEALRKQQEEYARKVADPNSREHAIATGKVVGFVSKEEQEKAMREYRKFMGLADEIEDLLRGRGVGFL